MKRKVLITGSAGFIGYHLSKKLVERGDEVIGLDNINDYYDVNLKYGRLEQSGIDYKLIRYGEILTSKLHPNYRFIQCNLQDQARITELFEEEGFTGVVNLAAQAGVRYSLENPYLYVESNVNGFMNILEACRHNKVGHLVYASTSSVYGLNTHMPLAESAPTEHPMTLYAATKKANEMMAHSYSHLFKLPTTGLRFFTVYGPWGRPDMALFIFTKAILNGDPVQLFNQGDMIRDFTYIDDIVEGIIRCLDNPASPNEAWAETSSPDPATSSAPYAIYNIGNGNPIKISTYIEAIEDALNSKAIKKLMPMQLGDVPATHADVSALSNNMGFTPKTLVKEGVKNFIEWYKLYYNI
jgi:UDP-glucuronate 4-epimerase